MSAPKRTSTELNFIPQYLLILFFFLTFSLNAFAHHIGKKVIYRPSEQSPVTGKVIASKRNAIGKFLTVELESGQEITALIDQFSFPETALTIIDMEEGEVFQNDYDPSILIENLKTEIRKAKLRGQLIILVEGGWNQDVWGGINESKSISCIREEIGNYPNTIRVHKRKSGGGTAMEHAIAESGRNVTHFHLAGVNTGHCVKATAYELLTPDRLKDIQQVAILARSCASPFTRKNQNPDAKEVYKELLKLSQKLSIKDP